jgi:hypothetical protein
VAISQADFQLKTHWVKVKVILRLAVFRQSVHIGLKPLETHGQTPFYLFSN